MRVYSKRSQSQTINLELSLSARYLLPKLTLPIQSVLDSRPVRSPALHTLAYK